MEHDVVRVELHGQAPQQAGQRRQAPQHAGAARRELPVVRLDLVQQRLVARGYVTSQPCVSSDESFMFFVLTLYVSIRKEGVPLR